jgi:hypothetical protein
MSKEMLPGKSSPNPAGGMESTIVVEEKKREEGGVGRLPLFLIAVGLGAVVLISISVLAPVSFYSYVESPGSVKDSGNGDRGDGVAAAAAIPTGLAPSAKATDGNGIVIQNNGVTKSGTMTITGHSDSKYDVGLQCWIDSLPLYCSSDSVTVSGLPSGEHRITIVEPSSGETIVRAFSWNIS